MASDEAKSEAFDRIHDDALRARDLIRDSVGDGVSPSHELIAALDLLDGIAALARYQFNVLPRNEAD